MANQTNNPDLDFILSKMTEIASQNAHKYVSVDHLFFALVSYKPIQAFLRRAQIDVDTIIMEFTDFFASDSSIERLQSQTQYPKKTEILINIFEKSKVLGLSREIGGFDAADLLYILLIDDNVGIRFCKIIDSYSSSLDCKTAVIRSLQEHIKRASGGMEQKFVFVSDTKIAREHAKPRQKTILDEFCINLNELAKTKKISPVIGREEEITKIIQVLGRKNKQNVILVGDAGVGKSAIVEGFALKILLNQVPDQFKDCTIYSLDMGSLVAGTKFRGEFEERIKMIIDAACKSPKNILFIDEIHMIRGAGSNSESSMDAANILKPALSRGQIRVIGATTYDEYRKHFEKDKALMRRFFKLDVNEPSIAETKQILKQSIEYFENFHNVKYDIAAIDLSVDLANKYIHDKKFPDKAFDIIDNVGSRIKLFKENITSAPLQISIADIEKEVSLITKVPVTSTSTEVNDKTRLKDLAANLKTKIYGQDEAVEKLVNYILIGKSGLREVGKPLLSALLRGQTGVGKTEVAKQLAKELGISLVRFDMSEYQEKHSVSKLIGSPPGYVGFSEGAAGSGLLINTIETTPHCVLLLDEIEKADPQVLDVLLQIMDYGMLTSSSGKTVSFRNVIILMSANLGAKDADKSSIGFGREKDFNFDKYDSTTNNFFSPEFRNRLDLTVTFNKLSKEVMVQIIDKFINETNDLLKERKVSIELSEQVKEYFVDETIAKNLGARPLNVLINEKIKQPLSKILLFSNTIPGTVIKISLEDNEIVLSEVVSHVVA